MAVVTPILGDTLSQGCRRASTEYIALLAEALTSPANLTQAHLTALQRLDSSGAIPFLQDGGLADQKMINICDQLGEGGDDLVAKCKEALEPEAQWIGIPYGLATAPGLELKCRRLEKSKYCVNYLLSFPADYSGGGDTEERIELDVVNPLVIKNTPHLLLNEYMDARLNQTVIRYPKISRPRSKIEDDRRTITTIDLDPRKLPSLSDILIPKQSAISKLVTALTNISTEAKLFEADEIDHPYFWTGFLITMWWMNNLFIAPSLPDSTFPYQGVCYPDACTKQDIQDNNVFFMKQIFSHVEGSPIFAFTPLRNADSNIEDIDEEKYTRGCTDDEKYNIEWEEEIQKNTDAQTTFIVLAIIGFFILIGTLVDVSHRITQNASLIGGGKKPNSESGLGFQMLVAFSLVSNTEFIFQTSTKKGSNRLDCLDGIRAISMTWVILGHNFLFGSFFVHHRNHEYSSSVREKHEYFAFEAIKQGEYSVDTFLFIGATLLSYLLLKDLDKSDGWFNLKGPMMILFFYLNRYLRIAIPLGLVIAVFIGVTPFMISEPTSAHMIATNEAESCRNYWWRHVTFINIWQYPVWKVEDPEACIQSCEGKPKCNLEPPELIEPHCVDDCVEQRCIRRYETDGCLGQTWYLAFDMEWFLVSPLVVYPLWLTKFGGNRRMFGLLWWTLLFLAFVYWSILYIVDSGKYENFDPIHNPYWHWKLPTWNFAPWGWRSHCYMLGLLMGYILHTTKDKTIKISWFVNVGAWIVAFLAGFAVVYGPYDIPSDYHESDFWLKYRAFVHLHKLTWGLCLSWVVFACVKGYGGPINDFLSWGFWSPISKVSFMTYLFHMSFNWYYFAMQDYNVDFSMWLLTEMFVSQVAVCLFIGLLGSLTLELPFGKIQKLLLGKLLGGK